MTTQRQADASGTQIHTEIEFTLRKFIRGVLPRLNEVLAKLAPEWQIESKWKRGIDGHFRESSKRTRILWPTLSNEWLQSQPEYDLLIERLKSDDIVSSHLDRVVGTKMSRSCIDAGGILNSLIYAMLDDEGHLAFTDEHFDSKWSEFFGLFCADRIASKMVSPLPGMVVPSFPLQLSDEIVLDRLTDEEVTRCTQLGVIRPSPPRFPLIYGEIAVGIRRTMYLPKVIRGGNEPHEPPETWDEGSFGNRPIYQDQLVIDDVLSAFRLFKHTTIQTAGLVSWTDAIWLKGGSSYRVLGRWPFGGGCELSECEVPLFLELWHLLEKWGKSFVFTIRRFNLAFDRHLLDDRIVDLVIAAESLFLGDLDEKYRGELRYRFALRAAKFIEHPNYGERDVFRVMKGAYDARSAIVHGGSVSLKDTRLPDDKSADLATFTNAIEEFVRLGIRKTLSMKANAHKLRQSESWDDLVFSKPDLLTPSPD